jgi:hypothetical protein
MIGYEKGDEIYGPTWRSPPKCLRMEAPQVRTLLNPRVKVRSPKYESRRLWYPIPLSYETVISGEYHSGVERQRGTQIDPVISYTVCCSLWYISMVRLLSILSVSNSVCVNSVTLFKGEIQRGRSWRSRKSLIAFKG